MKILVAPDKFKGSISAQAAAEAMVAGFAAVWPEATIHCAPIADGGEGFAATLAEALRGEWVSVQSQDALGREIEARYVWVAETSLAIIEMSEASGLWRLSAAERAPLKAHTSGTGLLMRDAVQRGARKILVGLGGSATTDGGIGMAEALAYEFLTSDGDPLPAIPGNLLALTRISLEHALELPEVVAACDVENPLLGARGTAAIFSPQKGATEKEIFALEEGLRNLADVVAQDLGCDFRETPGAGAAGGLGFGLLSFCGATIRSGFDVVAEALQLEARIAESDLVLTGEGRLDGQTLEGKGPAGVAMLARRHGKPVVAFAGSITPEAARVFDATCVIVDEPIPLEAAMQRGAELLRRAAERTARQIRLGTTLEAARWPARPAEAGTLNR